jgi:phospholipid/cholesterol/gamma-HCH transport system ATP-binding protein
MSATQPIIRLKNVSKAFGRLVVLNSVNLAIEPGKTTVVIGPSGCGKSVLLKHMIGLLRPDSGQVFFGPDEISSLSERRMVPLRRRMGFLFQGGALFDSMTVGQNVRFPLEEHALGSVETRRQRCREVLGLVGLAHLEGRYPEELSGGQKKRVALARAIVMDPQVIFYDEPTTGLDPIRSDLINELILKLQKVLGTTAVVVTHDMASARKVADRIVMLYDGTFVADTTPAELGQIDNEMLTRFVEGRASPEELAELSQGSLGGSYAANRPEATA